MTFKVMGLDLSLTDSGVAVIDSHGELVDAWSIVSDPKDGGRIERCEYIASTIAGRVRQHWPNLIVIEDYAFSRRTMLATLGELGGIVKLALWKVTGYAECWQVVTSSECKLHMTGSAAPVGGKERMIAAAQPYFSRLGFSGPITMNDNVCDSIGIAVTGLHKFRDYA